MQLYRAAIAASPDSAFLYRELGLRRARGAATPMPRSSISGAPSQLDPADAASIGRSAEFSRRAAISPKRCASTTRRSRSSPSARSDQAARRAARTDRAGGAARGVPRHSTKRRRSRAAIWRRSSACGSGRCSTAVARRGRHDRSAQPLGGSVDHGRGARRRDGGVREPYVPAARARSTRADLAPTVARLLADIAPQERIGQWRAAAVRFPTSPTATWRIQRRRSRWRPACSIAAPTRRFQPSRRVTGAEAVAGGRTAAAR